MSEREPVKKNDGSVPVEDILCTTYQMRNFYKQFRDGYIGHLDVMNYVQHLAAAERAPEGGVVLDVCCGRSLMLPLLRYYAKGIDRYVGVEIEEGNLTPTDQRVTDGKDVDEDYYPFDVDYVVTDAAEMHEHIDPDSVDFVIYTSSIEHMHPDHGRRSLDACREVMRSGAELFLSCPNTPPGQDGYDVQYQAHVYEWKLAELRQELKDRGFVITGEYGLTGKVRDLDDKIGAMGLRAERMWKAMRKYLPLAFLKPIMYAAFPEEADEVLVTAELSKFVRPHLGRE